MVETCLQHNPKQPKLCRSSERNPIHVHVHASILLSKQRRLAARLCRPSGQESPKHNASVIVPPVYPPPIMPLLDAQQQLQLDEASPSVMSGQSLFPPWQFALLSQTPRIKRTGENNGTRLLEKRG